jgi:eukaryotic-like serine/threonine-protein kinase
MPDLIGQDIGRYHIIEKLGEGGMAIVYKAYDTRLERDVAIKFIRKDMIQPALLERMLKRFEREARALAKMLHPSIIPIYDYGEHDGSPYLVMAYIPGGTLKERMGKPMSYDDAAELLLPIADALEYAHEQKIIHRDIKPANILMTERGRPLLSDFGIAKVLQFDDATYLTGTGVGIGTPEYMSPEQGMGVSVDHRTDIYALGVVFYELVTGRKLFYADTPMAVVFKHINDPIPRPKLFLPGLPEEVERVLFKALSKKPEERYQSMNEFSKALERILRRTNPTTDPISRFVSPEELYKGQRQNSEVIHEILTPEPSLNSTNVTAGEQLPKLVTAFNSLSNTSQGISLSDEASLFTIRKKKRQNRTMWILMLAGIGLLLYAGILIWQNGFSRQVYLWRLPKISFPDNPAVGSTAVSPMDNMTLFYVPAGDFLMGSTSSNDSQAAINEKPQHNVYLNAYWIDSTEVTNAMYAKCVAESACNPSENSYYKNSKFNNFPVINISWGDAATYCLLVGRRLPSEAEWEKAARGTDGRLYPWGNQTPTGDLLNFNQLIGDTTEVGSYLQGASPYGALDMAGNVEEWVNDIYNEDYYASSPYQNPTGASGWSRVARGGDRIANANKVRSSSRQYYDPNEEENYLGFRCVVSAVSP